MSRPLAHPAPLSPAAPAALGMDTAALADAVAFAEAHETPWPRDLRAHLENGQFEAPPDNAILGPVAPRGGPAGMILRHGAVVASWGETARTDMTFSVAKSYLSLLAGLAHGDGLIPDLDEAISARVRSPHFEGPRNGAVTWRHMLNLTSEWEGTLWDKSDVIDRNRDLKREGRAKKGEARPLHRRRHVCTMRRQSIGRRRHFPRQSGQRPAAGGEQQRGAGAADGDAGRPTLPARRTYCRCHWPFTSRTTAGRSPGRPSDSQRPASWLSVMVRARTLAGSMPAWVAHCRMRASS